MKKTGHNLLRIHRKADQLTTVKPTQTATSRQWPVQFSSDRATIHITLLLLKSPCTTATLCDYTVLEI